MAELLQAEAVTKRFEGLVAVDAVDLEVRAGVVHALIGPNGAGKTTFFNCLSGHVPATSGRVLFDGEDVTRMRVDRRARLGLARTFQNLQLFAEMTVLDSVKVGAHRTVRAGLVASMLRLPAHRTTERDVERASLEALERVGLTGHRDDVATELPFGAQRLVEIARALVSGPRLLLLDEPVSGLTSGEAAAVGDLLRRVADDGVGILLVEHDMRTVMTSADVVTVLDAGALIAHGEPAAIARDDRVIEAYLGAGWRDERERLEV